VEGLAERLRAAAVAVEPERDVEAGWLCGAAVLVDRGREAARSARANAVWLEELASEARARKATLLSRWVAAAGALRDALHAHDSDRGPLTEAVFPEWREPALRRHVDQALAFEVELERRLSSAYVARRLSEPATEHALRPALDALAAARTAWSAERDRPALSGPEAEEVRSHLLAVAGETSRMRDRVRAVVRAAMEERPERIDAIFPKRARPGEPAPEGGASHPGESLADELVRSNRDPSLDVVDPAPPGSASSELQGATAAGPSIGRATDGGATTRRGRGSPRRSPRARRS